MVRRIIWLWWIVLALAACAGDTPSNQPGTSAPVAAQSNQSPADVVQTFLSAWNDKNTAAMYPLLSPQSQEKYPQPVFEARYKVADDAINFNGLTFDIGATTIQGITAAVIYDVHIQSPFFGTIDDAGRTMRLVSTPQGWRIAWSNMDIFSGLVSEGSIHVDSEFPPRANIYDHNGNVLVEQGGTVIVLYVIQKDMPNVDDCLDLLSSVTLRSRAELTRLFANYVPETRFYVGEIDPDTYNARRDELANVCAITSSDSAASKVITRQTRRYVGFGALAHVTGYIARVPADQQEFWKAKGYQPGDLVGLAGIERAYEDTLAGRPERFLRITEPGGAVLTTLAGTKGAPPTPITLTIDRDLQMITAQAVNDAFSYASGNWGGLATGAAAVVLDVNTGAIRAMVSYPTFNPSVFNPDTYQPDPNYIATLSGSQRKPLVNKAIQEQYSPGSTFKIVTDTAALGEGVIGINDSFFCDLHWDGRKYGDSLPSRSDWRLIDGFDAAGNLTPSEALTASCDPFFYEMGARLFEKNPNALVSYAQRMGLGSALHIPGLDQAEAPGNLAPPGSSTEAINNAIGQGNEQFPPLQMALMVSAVANGGTVYKPYLVERIGGSDNTAVTFQAQPEVMGQIGVSQEVLDAIHKGMCAVTTNPDLGTAEFVFGKSSHLVAPYTVCGKTGTAQTGLYPNAWFVAYSMRNPTDKPELAIVVVVPNSREGSEIAGPIVRRILDNYYKVKVLPYPKWWFTDPYHPIQIPEGSTGG